MMVNSTSFCSIPIRDEPVVKLIHGERVVILAHLITLARVAEEVLPSPGWHFSPVDESQVATLAACCQIKHQQRECLEELLKTSEDEEEVENDDGHHTDVVELVGMEDTQLTSEFLDRLAEILSFKKAPTHVTSTAMIKKEDRVTIIAAHNGDTAWRPEKRRCWRSWLSQWKSYLTMVCCFHSPWDEPRRTNQPDSDVSDEKPVLGLFVMLANFYDARIRRHT